MSSKSKPSTSPPSSRPPPPAESGSGKYVVVMVVLVGAMAGLYFWKKGDADAVTPQPTPSSSAPVTVAHPPPHEDLDIPPPPPAVSDAAPDVAATKQPAQVQGGGNYGDGCNATTCGGRINADLSSALAFRAKTAHKCYDEALAQDPTLKGQVVINVKVGGNGNVCGASVASNELASGTVAPCIANRFRQGARLPSPSGGCVEVNVPMKLLPPH